MESARVMIGGALGSAIRAAIWSAGAPVAGREFLIALGPIDAALEGVGLIDVDEGVEALVHPGIAPLVGADDHREVGVSDLVDGDPEQVLALVGGAVEEDRRDIPCRRPARPTLMAFGQG